MKDADLLKAETVARMLLEILPPPSRRIHFDDVRIEEETFSLPDLEEPVEVPRIRERAAGLLIELEHLLSTANWAPRGDMPLFPTATRWTLGWVEREAPMRKVLRGYLLPVKQFPILGSVSDRAIAFLSKISGWNDYVKRENHPGVGIHYHYLSDAKKRSDVLLAWDTRWHASPGTDALRPLFGEKHAEGKAGFSARPWAWCDKKKISMYNACAGDLNKWPIGEFRCASQNALAVWPGVAVITPIQIVVATITAPGQKHRR